LKNSHVVLVLCATVLLLGSTVPAASAQARYRIDLLGLTWDHTALRTLVVPQPSNSWWNPGYLNASLRAINQWNHAVLDFSGSNASFAYLSRVRFVWTIGESLEEPGYDVYISWTEVYQETQVLGSSNVTYVRPCTIIRDTVHLGAKISEGIVLNEVDMQNVALHELGHVLGLGHASNPGDVMAPGYAPGSRLRALSNLDLYAVAAAFQWASRPVIPGVTSICPRTSAVRLPQDVEYAFLPIASGDLPAPSYWETLLDRLLVLSSRYLTVPLVFFVIAMIGLVLMAVGLSRQLRRRPEASQPSASPPGAPTAHRPSLGSGLRSRSGSALVLADDVLGLRAPTCG